MNHKDHYTHSYSGFYKIGDPTQNSFHGIKALTSQYVREKDVYSIPSDFVWSALNKHNATITLHKPSTAHARTSIKHLPLLACSPN